MRDRHWVTLRHATPVRNLPSILRDGLLIACATGKLSAVWLHSPSETGWAACHVAKRHHADVFEVAILEVSVPRADVIRHGRGKWFIKKDVPISAIKSVGDFGIFSDQWGSAK